MKIWEMDMEHEGGLIRDDPLLTLEECSNAIFDRSYEVGKRPKGWKRSERRPWQRVAGTAKNGRVLLWEEQEQEQEEERRRKWGGEGGGGERIRWEDERDEGERREKAEAAEEEEMVVVEEKEEVVV
eukprot:763128-Hanusia_phi.AAC.1